MALGKGSAVYEFDGFRLDVDARSLTAPDGHGIPLKPRVFDTLALLVEHRGELLTKRALLDAVWPGSVVEENSLNQNISTLRRALGEKPGENRFIATVPGRGYQFVSQVTELRHSAPARKSIAVLPFANVSDSDAEAFFVDGMTDELTAQLARISGLRVASRTSARAMAASNEPLPKIAAALDVSLIVEGSVLRSGDNVRITINLVAADSDEYIWTEQFRRAASDVLILQSAIALAVVRQIAVHISDTEQAALERAEPVNPQVYDACLKGLEHYYKLSPQDLDQSLRYFRRAIELDRRYARAYAGIAAVWIGRQQMGFTPTRIATPIAKEAAMRAIEFDPHLPEAHFVFSEVKGFGEFDFESAEMHMHKALELNPSFAEAYAVYSHQLICLGRREDAFEPIERALALDPLNPFFKAFCGVVFYFNRRIPEALEQFRLALEISPGLPFALQIASNCRALLGDLDGCVATQRLMMQALKNDDAIEAIDAGLAEGGPVAALRRLADVTAEQSLAQEGGAVFVAFRYAHSGDVDKTCEWYSRAIDQRDPNVPYIVSVFPEMDALVEAGRYEPLIERLDAARLGMMFAT